MRKHAQVVEELIEKVERNLAKDDAKATLGDYIRLVQLQKELEEDEPREIKVTWVEPKKTESSDSGNSVSAAAFAEEVSRFGGAIQGVFGTDRVGEKPGAVPGSDQAELFESGADGVDRGADVSDVAGCDAGGADRDSGAEPDSVRVQSRREFSGDARDAVEDFVPGGGGVRETAREQSGVVRAGRADLHAEAGVAAAGRAVAGSEGERGCAGSRCGRRRVTTGCTSGSWRIRWKGMRR